MNRKTELELIRILPLAIFSLLVVGMAFEMSGKDHCYPCQSMHVKFKDGFPIETIPYHGFNQEGFRDCLDCAIYEDSDYDWPHRDTEQVLSICPKATTERREQDRLKKLKTRGQTNK